MDIWLLGACWFFLAIMADFVAIRFKIAVALAEIFIGVMAAYLLQHIKPEWSSLGANTPWISFLAGFGAVVLTFLAGAELDPKSIKGQTLKVTAIGLVGFIAPFIGCTALTYYLTDWTLQASLLVGVALSTTSVAVVYAVMLELGLNRTYFGKGVLAACFINDLATVLALGFIFAPFTYKSIVFVIATGVTLFFLPKIARYLFHKFGNRHSEQESKFLFLILFGLGYLAFWSGSEPVLAAYLIGMVLATVLEHNAMLVKRLRAITFGLLTPFYFLRAGSFVSLSSLWAFPVVFLVLFGSKMISKFIGIYPVAKMTKYSKQESIYITLLMSTGLTFGTICSLYGLQHNIINQAQYSLIVAAVIGTAIVPTIIANKFFLPRHHLPTSEHEVELPPK
jgi:Kef-type K+ transport system membrane component KefB